MTKKKMQTEEVNSIFFFAVFASPLMYFVCFVCVCVEVM